MTSQQTSRRGNLALGAVLGVAAGVALTAVAWALLIPASAVPAPSPSPSSASASTSPSADATDTAPTESNTPSESPSASPTPTSETPSGIVTELPSGSWVTVLKSLPKELVTPENALEQAAKLGNDQHKATVIDTDAFDKLNPGYWAIVVPGQNSRAESNAVCDDLGIGLGNNCYPREV